MTSVHIHAPQHRFNLQGGAHDDLRNAQLHIQRQPQPRAHTLNSAHLVSESLCGLEQLADMPSTSVFSLPSLSFPSYETEDSNASATEVV